MNIDNGNFELKEPCLINLIAASIKVTSSDENIPYELEHMDVVTFGRLRFLVKHLQNEDDTDLDSEHILI